MAVIAEEPRSLRRADGLCALLFRAWADPESRERLLGAFTAACAAGHGWRRDRLLAAVAPHLAADGPHRAEQLAAMIEDARIARRAQRDVAAALETGAAP